MKRFDILLERVHQTKNIFSGTVRKSALVKPKNRDIIKAEGKSQLLPVKQQKTAYAGKGENLMKGTQKMARMSWDEMVKQYPNMWVAVKDAEMNGIDVLSGEVVTVQPDNEICKFRMKHRGAGFVFRRTSESGFDGHINSDFRIRVE